MVGNQPQDKDARQQSRMLGNWQVEREEITLFDSSDIIHSARLEIQAGMRQITLQLKAASFVPEPPITDPDRPMKAYKFTETPETTDCFVFSADGFSEGRSGIGFGGEAANLILVPLSSPTDIRRFFERLKECLADGSYNFPGAFDPFYYGNDPLGFSSTESLSVSEFLQDFGPLQYERGGHFYRLVDEAV